MEDDNKKGRIEMIRVNEIKLSIEEDLNNIKEKIIKKLRIQPQELLSYQIYKESIDARKGDEIFFVYTVDVSLKDEGKVLKKHKNLIKTPSYSYKEIPSGKIPMNDRPVVIGTGPAGMFAGLILAQRGYKPILLERGRDVDARSKDVEDFWLRGQFQKESNVQFGEGGAGTFSDGKLTTRIKDVRVRKVLEEFVEAGAPEEILYSYKPHIGTDILKDVVKNIRKEMKKLGGDIRFDSKVTDLLIEGGKIKAVEVNCQEWIRTENVVLAIGHSARDTYEMLYQRGVQLRQKPFSIGVRIEHPQELIDQSQYKKFSGHSRLGAADYRLTYQSTKERAVYTFCMCPGGMVVAANSEEAMVVTNGMSEYSRDRENANSALLVQVNTEDFGGSHPLQGMEFQRIWEREAFKLGGSNYHAPVQRVEDFLEGVPSKRIGMVKPSYLPGVTPTDLRKCLPDFVIEAMKEAIPEMDKKLKGFALADALMTGVETRSSAPVRIERFEETLESLNVKGLYPVGEGGGYAGGIVSAAVDGIKAAEKIIQKYRV
nr:NAD(P)/FAD-dependent oxidoreductase [Geosporobacter ferrireducens]